MSFPPHLLQEEETQVGIISAECKFGECLSLSQACPPLLWGCAGQGEPWHWVGDVLVATTSTRAALGSWG